MHFQKITKLHLDWQSSLDISRHGLYKMSELVGQRTREIKSEQSVPYVEVVCISACTYPAEALDCQNFILIGVFHCVASQTKECPNDRLL